MAFRLADVKKTVRSRADGNRYIHPKLLDGPSITAQVGLALAYFHARLGRARHEVDAETLVRFFGDPKVARGLVACLSATYRWRTQQLAEVLTPREVARLSARGLHTPCDLRLHLYDRLNADADGFLNAPREGRLAPLATALGLEPGKLDQLVALDADENAVLVRVGPPPEPEQVVALYNFQAVDAILRHSTLIELHGVTAAGRDELAASCALYGVDLSASGETVCLHNKPDVFGSYARAGARVTRALYSAAASVPALVTAGCARVALPGKTALYELERETLKALTANTRAFRRATPCPGLREAWDRHRAARGTEGWRLQAWPEPLLTPAGLALAPYAARRDEQHVLLWPAESDEGLRDAAALREAGVAALPIVARAAMRQIPADLLVARLDDGVEALVATLAAQWGGQRVPAGVQALDGLLVELDELGFIPEARVIEVLRCASPGELRTRLRFVDPVRATYVAGLGLCSAGFADEMRKGLRRKRRREPAA